MVCKCKKRKRKKKKACSSDHVAQPAIYTHVLEAAESHLANAAGSQDDGTASLT